ncbi:hypothetical protein G6011_05986 [Alternaria panax]|uniref:F-box domain-containing protein n=1 Tax=Alternaria panax TaxID=48097 RepID=A0AAD4I7Q0_9PLEO|nr:hypothetical protein G6011_05986 [Alternaria panax]
MPYLPAEIHRIIAQYVHREDLPSYRLVNRQLYDIGTEELFSTIVSHYSTASIDRLKELSANERLRRHVKTIFWDTNLWSLNNVRDFHEWERYFAHRAEIDRMHNADFDSRHLYTSGYTQLSQNRREWEAYLDRVTDEKKARKALERLQVLGCFQNLRSIHIVHGALLPAHRGLQKVAELFLGALPAPAVLRRGLELEGFNGSPGVEAFLTIQQYCKSFLKKFRLNAVHPCCFSLLEPGAFDNLSSLNIKLSPWTCRNNPSTRSSTIQLMNDLKMFLVRSKQLESLRIDLNRGNATTRGHRAVLSVRQVFGDEHTWPKLRKLSLRNFFTTPESLLLLLSRHSSTLKDLRLHSIGWEKSLSGTPKARPDRSLRPVRSPVWPQVLQKMSELLCLEHVTVSGMVDEIRFVFGWRLNKNDGLAAAITDYLITGRQCPLIAEDVHFDGICESEDSTPESEDSESWSVSTASP